MPMLCDVNLLLALVTDRHAHHAVAVRWFNTLAAGDAVVCHIAQMGLLRLLNNPSVMQEEALTADACWDIWRRMLEDERIQFTVLEPPDLDAAFERFVSGRVFSPRLWTDAYLAAFADAGGMTLATFDRGFRNFPGLTCEVLDPGQTPY